MKYTLSFLLLFITIIGISQTELTSAAAMVNIKDTSIEVEEQLNLILPDSIKNITLKTLKFDQTVLSVNGVKANGKAVAFKQSQANGLDIIEISLNGESIKKMEITYTVQVEKEAFYIPIFFTDLPVTASDNDFFKLDIQLKQEQDYLLHFPKVDKIETSDQGVKKVTLSIPALPSLIRMELPTARATAFRFSHFIDWMVAFIFVIIGYLIWKYRKQLMYG